MNDRTTNAPTLLDTLRAALASLIGYPPVMQPQLPRRLRG